MQFPYDKIRVSELSLGVLQVLLVINKGKRRRSIQKISESFLELVFKKDFEELARKHSQFKPIFFVTRQKSPDPSHICRRIEIADIVGKKSSKEKEYFICGSIPFVGDLWKALRKKGIAEEMICTEAFFSH